MSKINPHKVGLAVGSLVGLWHVVWSLLVALGLADALFNFILKLHFLNISHTIAPFDLGRAAVLVLITTSVGYLSGFVLGLIWNRSHNQ